MTAPDSLSLHVLAEDNLAAASPGLLRAMVKTFADALMSAEADALCNAEYGQVSDERVNHRNGYRPCEWDTRAGTVELAIPKLRSGSYFPHWLLERRRAEQTLISVVATAYLLGVSTRRVEKLAESADLGASRLETSNAGRWCSQETQCWPVPPAVAAAQGRRRHAQPDMPRGGGSL
jgi:putative transposase